MQLIVYCIQQHIMIWILWSLYIKHHKTTGPLILYTLAQRFNKNAPATQFGYHCIFSMMLSEKCCSWEVKHTAIYKWHQWLKRLNDQAWKQMEVNKSSLLGEVAILDSSFKKRECTQRTNIHYKILYTHYVFVFPTVFFQNVHTHARAHIYLFS